MKHKSLILCLLLTLISGLVNASPPRTDSTLLISKTITAGACPSAAFTFSNTPVCAGVPIPFTNTSTGTIVSYVWNFGDGTNDSTANPSHGFFKNYGNGKDTFVVSLTVTSNTGCTNTITHPVIFNQKPEAKIVGPQTVCTGLGSANFIFNNASSTASTNTDYYFIWGDGTANTDLPTFTTAQSHTYNIGTNPLTEIVTGSNGCKDTVTTLIYLGSNPSVGIASPGNTYICANQSITFPITNTSSNSSGTTYKITFNDGTPAQLFTQANIPASISHIYTHSSCGTTSNGIANSFIAKIEATNPCAVSQGAVTPIYVSETPTPAITLAQDTVCASTNVSITNATWAFKAVSTAGACSNGTFVWSILPNSGFTVQAGQTLGNTFNNADPSSWLGSNANTLNLKFTVPGTYTVRLTVGGSAACGSGFIEKTIVVNPMPVSTFTLGNAAGCAPFNVNTTNNTGAASFGANSYQWSVTYSNTQNCAPNTSSYTITNGSLTSPNPQFTFNNPGVYTVGLITTAPAAACASPIATQVITVKTIPNVNISIPTTLCSGQSFTPAASVINCFSATAATYAWSFNGGTPASSTFLNPGAVSITALGAHTISLAATNECGTSTDSKVITVNPAPTIAGTATNPTNCAVADGSIRLTGLAANTAYTVTYTKGVTVVNVNKTSDGTGSINITGLGAGLYSNISVNIVGTCSSNVIGPYSLVDPSPGIPVVSNNGPICSGGAIIFTAASPTPGVTYAWTGPNGYTSTQQNPTIANAGASASGTYFVNATISNCNAGATTVVVVNQTPAAPGVSNITYCQNAIATALTATTTGSNTLRWYTAASGGTALASAPTPTTITAGSVTYYVSAVSASGGCEGPRAAITVTINSTPTSISGVATNPTTCSGTDGSILLSGLAANTTYTLSYQKGGSTISATRSSDATGNMLMYGLSAGVYSTITVSNGACPSNVVGPFTLVDPSGPAIPTVSNNGPLCAGSTLNLAAVSSTPGVNYTWVGPKAFASTLQNPSLNNITTASAGTYFVTASLNNCSATGSTAVVVRATPNAPAVSNVAYCEFATAAPLTATATSGNTLNWYTVPTGGTPLGAAPTPSTATTGNTKYYVSQVAATGCESPRAVITVSVAVTPVISATAINPITCYGTEGDIIMKGLNPGTSYTVHYNNGVSNITTTSIADSLGNAEISALPAGTYSNIYVSIGSCTSNIVGPFTLVDPSAPVVPTLSYNGPVCAGSTLSLNAATSGTNLSYAWTGPNGFTSTQQNPSLNATSPLAAGTYTVVVISNNCSAVKSILVALKPQLFLTSQVILGAVCNNTAFNYTASSNNPITSFSWSRAAVLNISNPAAQSTDTTGKISETLINTGALPVHVLYTFFLTAGGCTSPQLIDLIVNPDTKASFTFTNAGLCAPGKIDSSIIHATTNTNSSVAWYVNNNLVGNNLIFPGYTITNPVDTAIVKLVTTNTYGCSNDSVTQKFFILPKPAPSFTKSTAQGCGPLTVSFTNTTTPAGNNLYRFIWNFGNGDTSHLQNPPSIVFKSAASHLDTTYYIRLTAMSQCDSVFSLIDSVVVHAIPAAKIQQDTTGACSIVVSPYPFKGNNISTGPAIKYYWDYGDGSIDSTNTMSSVAHLFTTPVTKTYLIQLKAVNACGTNIDTLPLIVYQKNIVTNLGLSGPGATSCAPDTIHFTNNTTGANLFRISFGDGSIDSIYTSNLGNEQIKHYYKAAGIYNVTMKASNTCNLADTTISFLITLNQKPNGGFSTSKAGYCKNENIVFQNQTSAGGYTYEWSFGDGGTSTVFSPTHKYALEGTYTVTMVIKSLNSNASFCTDTVRQAILVNGISINNLVTNNVPSNCAPFTFTGNSNLITGNTVNWTFTDPTSKDTLATGITASHLFNNAGDYKVKLFAFNPSGCNDSANILVHIIPTPKAAFLASDTIHCLNSDTIRFTNKSTYVSVDPVTYNWFIDGALMSSTTNFKYNFSNRASTKSATAFIIMLVATNSNGCSDTATQKVTIVPRSLPSFTISPTTGCAKVSVSFNNTSQFANSFKWYVNDSLFSNMNTPYPIVLSKPKTDYFIKLVADQTLLGCGADSVFNTITTFDKPVNGFTDFNMALACTGNLTVQLTDISKASNGSLQQFYWDFGDGIKSNLANPIHGYTRPGDYQISHYVTDDKGCFSDTLYKNVRNFGKPTVKFKLNTICLQTPSIPVYTTHDLGFGNTKIKTYLWDFGDGTIDTSSHPMHTYLKEGKYTVVLTTVADSSCVNDTSVQTINVLGKPTADFKFINNCINNMVKFTDASSAGYGQTLINNYKWEFGDATPASYVPNPMHTYNIVSKFAVTLSINSSLCPTLTDSKTRIISIVEPRAGRAYPPKVTSYGIPTVLELTEKEAASVQQGGSAASYLWMPSTALSSARVQNPIAIYNKNDGTKINYTIAITDTSGCVINDTQEVWVFAEPNIYAPTAFTPNHDGVNDIFMPVYVEIMRIQYLRIFDRWGNLLWETADMGKGWDGVVNGKPMPMDTYVYMVVGIDVNGKTVSRKGDLTLIRD
ncbi:MAG: PKD domain-containing protein [Bacteroidota bacterium]